VDVGLVAFPQKDSRLQAEHLKNDTLVLICHPDHPMARKKRANLGDLAGYKFIGFESDIPTRHAIDRKLKMEKVEVRHVMDFDNIETVKRAVEINAGISIVPHLTVVQEVAKKTLIEVPIDDSDLQRPLAAIYKKTKVLSPAIKEFIQMLKSTL